MKKHSGTVLLIGVMALVFGILLMGTVNAVSGMIAGPALASAGVRAAGIAETASDLSFATIAIGAFLLALGIFMRGSGD